MEKFQKAYKIIAESSGLDERAFDFIEKIFSLEGLTQQMFKELKIILAIDDGVDDHEFKIICATSDHETYNDIGSFLKKSLPEYPYDKINELKGSIYTTKSGRKIPNTRKDIGFRLYDHKLDGTFKGAYTSKTYATLTVYDRINPHFIFTQDPWIESTPDW